MVLTIRADAKRHLHPTVTIEGRKMNHKTKLGIVIAVGNQKGGTGKTTNSVHLAAALGLCGYRCLIIDLDPAAGATRHLGVPENSFAGSLELLTTDETVQTLAVTEGIPKREVSLSSEAEKTLSQLVQTYRQATRTRLSNSHVIRALLRGVAHGMSEIRREAELLGTLKLPSNAKGCEHEREQFEDALASSFVSAMRSLPSYRSR